MLKDEAFNGKGRLTRINKANRKESHIYQGQYVKGKQHGKGVLKISDPKGIYFYEGDWVNEVKSGEGLEIWDNDTTKASYKGSFKNDLKNGYGVMDAETYTYKG